MCHLFFALPLLALPVFWLWPVSVALPLYVVAVAGALLAYAYAWKAWRMPRMNGLDAMLGMQGKVVATGAREVRVGVATAGWRVDGDDAVASVAGIDVTWWVLLAMGLIGGGVLVAIATMS